MADDKHSTCVKCSQRIKTSKSKACVCRNAVFCSELCRVSGHAGCSGERVNWSISLDDIDMNLFNSQESKLVQSEMERYPHMFSELYFSNSSNIPAIERGVKNGEGLPGDFFMLACCVGSRVQGVSISSTNTTNNNNNNDTLRNAKSEHETDELACKYYRMASKGGYHLASLFLAQRLLEKRGSATYSTEAVDLLEECWLVGGIALANELLSKSNRIGKEILAMAMCLENITASVPNNISLPMVGPNAAAIITAVSATALFQSKFCKLHDDKRPFMFQREGIRLSVAVSKIMRERGIRALYGYGRAGTGKQVRDLAMGEKANGPR
jgi:hypothetical protein